MTIDKTLLPSTIRGVNLPSKSNRAYCVGYDWVQWSGTIDPASFPAVVSKDFELVLKDYGTRNFNVLYEVKTLLHGEPQICATIEAKPRVSFIKGDVVLVKLDNKFCYNGELVDFIKDLNGKIGIEFKHYVRIDTFLDFQHIGKSSEIQKFLLACASRQLVVKGKSMRTHHERNIITGITWGSASSPVSFTIYNKSREMRKKGVKPWIIELWRQAGFDEQQDTYRLEFRHKKDLKTFVDTGNGEILGSHADINLLGHLDEYLRSLYENHFHMAFYSAGVRFSRMERIYPFELDSTLIRPMRLSEKQKSNNYIKCQIKTTVKDALLFQAKGEKIITSLLFEYVERLVFKHDIYTWFKKKFSNVNFYTSQLTVFDIASSEIATSHALRQASLLN